MKKNVKKLVALALVTAMASLTGCSGGSTTTTTAAPVADAAPATTVAPTVAEVTTAAVEIEEGGSVSKDTDIVAAISVDFTTMDPLDTSDTLSGGIQRLMMDGFFGFDDQMKLIPMLATGYEANDEATEFIITLREGISFSDGTPWDAEAAKANLDRWGDKTLGLKRTTLLSNSLKSTEIVDDYTVKVNLVEPFGAFINTLAHPACLAMSPVQIEAGETACAEDPIGTGQYTFVEWVAGERAVIELNPEWWGYDADICGGTSLVASDAGFKTITFKPVSENATRVAMVQSGEAQVTWPAPEESVELLKADENLSVAVTDGIVVRFLTMNNLKAPFDDVNVRKAINHAINKEAYCAVVKNGLAIPATSIIGPAVQYYKANDVYEYNIETAKALLAEAGYPDGFDTTLMCSSTTFNLKQAEFLQQQLAQVGINMEIIALENAVLNQKVQDVDVDGSEAEVDLYATGWSPSTGDADWGIRPLLASESVPPMSYNMAYYQKDEFDQLLYDALNTADSDERAAAYEAAQDMIWEDCPVVCLGVDSNSIVTSKNVADVKIFPDGCINLRNGKMAQ